ncbi:MAG: hypothetical protein V3S14_00310, partial [Anaerolineae bacterium]
GGGWCPIYVVLSIEGADVEGELRVVIDKAGGSDEPNLYTRSVLLPAHSRKAYFLYVPSTGASSRSHLTVQLFAENELLMSQQVPVAWLDERDRLYGVAGSNPSALNFLNDVVPAGGGAEVAHLDLEALPLDPLGWEGLDVLILNDVDTTVLDGDRRRALETWLAHGGHLIVGGGAGVARTVAGVSDLLPVVVGGARSVDDLWALGEWVGAFTVAGPYDVVEVSLQDGEVLVTQEQGDDQGSLILLARRPYGAGKVDFVAFDAGLKPFTRWDDNGRMWHLIVGTKGVGTQRFSVRNGQSAREAVNAIPGLELPSTLQILGFMLIYTILIGPVNYVFLRKLDRRELAWLTIPVLIVGFSACAYWTGFQIRGVTAIVHRLAVVYVPEESEVGRVSQVVGLFSPRRTTYDVWVADAGVYEIPEDYYRGSTRQSLHVVEEAGGGTVTGLRVDVGGIQPFVAEGYTDVPGIETDLRLALDEAGVLRLEGSVRNGETPLQGAVLLAGGDEQLLGDLDAGEQVSVHLLLSSGGSLITPKPRSFVSPAYSNVPERILGPGDYWGDRTLYRRYQFLQALFPYNGPGLEPGIYLIGWSEENVPLPVEVVDRPFSAIETALYVYALPVAGLETGATIVIPPSLITRQVEEVSANVSVWPEGCHMEPEAEVVFRFSIWQGMTVQQVEELVLDMQGSSYGNSSLAPTVSLWNQESGDWERLLGLGWGQHSIPNADAYVLPPGKVLVRLETGAEWAADVNSLTITIKGRR